MGQLTNLGKQKENAIIYQGATPPANFFLQLFTNAVVPDADTVSDGELTEIPTGNGYTAGGITVARNTTDFPTNTKDDALDESIATMADKVIGASGGPLPASGDPIFYGLMTEPGTVGSRDVWAFFTFGSTTVTDGNDLTIASLGIKRSQ